MSDSIEQSGEFEWDEMVDAIVDLVPVKLSSTEWRELREKIHTCLWEYIRDLFDSSAIEFRDRNGASEVRLWMTVGQDCVDFQKGFATDEVVAKAYSVTPLSLAKDAIAKGIAAMEREAAE